jgi:hypothetical protein
VNNVYRDHTKTQNYSCVITVQDVILKNTANSEELIYNNEVIGKIETILSNFSYTVDFN